jgi:hypothetical protein
MRIELLQGLPRVVRIMPESLFERQWLQDFIGGGGPADDWQFLEHTLRKAEFRVHADGITISHLDIGVHDIGKKK